MRTNTDCNKQGGNHLLKPLKNLYAVIEFTYSGNAVRQDPGNQDNRQAGSHSIDNGQKVAPRFCCRHGYEHPEIK